MYDDHHRDDIAILMARLRRIGADRHVTWNLTPKLTAARRARSLIRRPLRQWGLTELIPAAELVVSELVTNAVRYAQSKISLRLVLESALFCEILDDSAALPRLRQASEDDERGRGLQVVSQIAQRWEQGAPAQARWSGASFRCLAARRRSSAGAPDRQHTGSANVNGRTGARHGASQQDVLNPA